MGLCLVWSFWLLMPDFLRLWAGAFVMGSILAGTNEAERIEKVVQPVKDLFGAILFRIIGRYIWCSQQTLNQHHYLSVCPINSIVGQIFFGTVGILASGQTLQKYR